MKLVFLNTSYLIKGPYSMRKFYIYSIRQSTAKLKPVHIYVSANPRRPSQVVTSFTRNKQLTHIQSG